MCSRAAATLCRPKDLWPLRNRKRLSSPHSDLVVGHQFDTDREHRFDHQYLFNVGILFEALQRQRDLSNSNMHFAFSFSAISEHSLRFF